VVCLLFIGIDWASEEHAVEVHDHAGGKIASFKVEHSSEGFETLVGRLRGLGEPGELPVAIERPDGRLVDRLLEAGHPVIPVSTNAIKAWREAEVVSGAKSDPADAGVIAEYLRLRFRQLSPLRPFSDQTRALRAAVRARADLVDQRTAANNQLEATLDTFWPGAKEVFSDLTRQIALAFLQRYPTPASAAKLDERAMAAFLKKQGYSGGRSAAELVERLRRPPAGIAAGAEMEARKTAVLAYVSVIRSLNAAIRDLDKEVAARLGEHPDGEIFTSLPRSGLISAAQMLAEWGDCREAYDGAESIAALAGMSPVTKASGKHKSVHFRWACNKRFRNAMTTFAGNSRHESEWAADIYRRARARGADHPHAVRILARAWIRVIFRCWLDRVAYNPAKHKGADALAGNQTAPEKAAA
jgi:transposase